MDHYMLNLRIRPNFLYRLTILMPTSMPATCSKRFSSRRHTTIHEVSGERKHWTRQTLRHCRRILQVSPKSSFASAAASIEPPNIFRLSILRLIESIHRRIFVRPLNKTPTLLTPLLTNRSNISSSFSFPKESLTYMPFHRRNRGDKD